MKNNAGVRHTDAAVSTATTQVWSPGFTPDLACCLWRLRISHDRKLPPLDCIILYSKVVMASQMGAVDWFQCRWLAGESWRVDGKIVLFPYFLVTYIINSEIVLFEKKKFKEGNG